MNAQDILKKRSKPGQFASLLTGGTVPLKTMKVKTRIIGTREAPDNWNAYAIIDIDETHGAGAFALNKTNFTFLVSELGNNMKKWKGAKLELTKVLVNNPSTGAMQNSLRITSAKKR